MIMETLYTVSEICARYHVRPATARKIMRQMVHMEKPLMVTARAVAEWERGRTYTPERVNDRKEVFKW